MIAPDRFPQGPRADPVTVDMADIRWLQRAEFRAGWCWGLVCGLCTGALATGLVLLAINALGAKV